MRPAWRPRRTSGTADHPAREARLETARRQAELAGAYTRYQELLGEAGAIDFGDQVALALRLLREHPAARAELQARFRYVLVDEFQDVNRAQAELVALVAEPRRNIAVVGDDDQSIYRFRGAATGAIVDFLGRFRGARTIVLRRNYRSRAGILDAAYRLVRFNDPDRLEVQHGITKRLIAQRGEPRGRRAFATAPVRHVAFGTGSEEADWIAGEIAARIANGASPRDHAILVRANSDADAILRSLNVAAVPWRFSGISGLYARPEIRVLLSFLRVVGDPDSSVDVYGLAASDIYGLGGEDLAALANRARRTNRSLWETFAEVDGQPGLLRLHPETRAALARLVADLHRYVELGHQRPAGELLYDFLRSSGSLARLMTAETAAAEEALSNVARFFEIVRAQSDLLCRRPRRSSLRPTSRRSSTPATTPRLQTWIPMPTPSRSRPSTRRRGWSGRSSSSSASWTAASRPAGGGSSSPSRMRSCGASSQPATLTCRRSGGSSTWG